MKQLSAQDAQFLYIETNKSLSQVTSVAIFDPSTAPDGHVRFKQIIEHVRGRLYTSPIYRRRIYHVPLELDYPYWVEDEHFDIEYHIRHGRLPVPSDWRQLCIHLARFHTRPLDMQRAPWEMYVIEGIDNAEDQGIPKGSYAVATKIHHAAADGMAMLDLFSGLMDIDQQGTPAISTEGRITSERFEKPSTFQMSARGLISTVKSPFKVGKSLMKFAPQALQTLRGQNETEAEDDKVTVPQTRFNLETSAHRVFDATVFPLEDFKPIRSLVEGATVNDVVLAVCSGALRQYLLKHKELPSDSLRAFCPVNVRGAKGEGVDSPGNNISTMAPLLFTTIADPVDRLVAIEAETKEQKAARKGISARIMTDVTRHVPAATQLLAARLLMNSEMAGRMTNVCISNVPGPQVPVYMNGAKLVTSMGMGPLADRMGLFMAITSYAGMMTFGVTSCRRTLPDIDFFMECLRENFAELKALGLKNLATKSVKNTKPTKKTQTKAKVAGTKTRKTKRKAPKKTGSAAESVKKTSVSKPAEKTGSKKVSKKVVKKAPKKVTRRTNTKAPD